MEKALVSAATGALGPVIGKLAELLEKEYMLFKHARRNVKILKTELEHMHAFIERLSWVEDPNAQAKLWMGEVRELSYDLEVTIDEFMLGVDGTPDELKGIRGFIQRVTGLFTKFKTRCRVAKEVQGLKEQVKEAGERRARYKIDDNFSVTRNKAPVDSRVRYLFKDQSDFVGVDGPKEELIKLLTKPDDQDLQVVSIVGQGGLGKTTLAYQVYNKLGEEFKHRAFVSVSRNPNMMDVLRNIHSQVIIPRYIDTPVEELREQAPQLLSEYRRLVDAGKNLTDEQQFMIEISKFLQGKRYLVVVDDIWDLETWETIKCIFPSKGCGSRIITTTRIKEVAESSSSSHGIHVYKLSPLSVVDSECLFLRRIFGSQDECPSHLKDISNKILAKCDGLPLAIISIAGLLANKVHTKDQWNRVQNSIGHSLERDKGVRGMIRILSLSYFDLPHYLKSCLLYLSIFPEKYEIEKKSLIRKWISEGFIHEEHGYTPYEIGDKCFHELINRSLIQPVKTNAFGEVKTCQVHDIVLDFIVSKSVEENFVTICGVPNITNQQPKKVRRLSFKGKYQEHSNLSSGLILSHARSVTVFGKFDKFPSLLESRIIRVLDIQDCDLSKEPHLLQNIGLLFQLKFLSLKSTKISELPKNIARLQCLETLNLRDNLITELPATIVRIGRLVSLFIDQGVKLPDGIRAMLELQELQLITVSKQPNNFWLELSKLTKLGKLSLSLESGEDGDAWTCKEHTMSMVSSICKLGTLNLHSLSVSVGKGYDYGFLQESWYPPPSNLSRLVIKKEPIARVPNWISSSLVNLEHLYLSLKIIRQEDVRNLGSIPALVHLVLNVHSEEVRRRRRRRRRRRSDIVEEEEKDEDIVKEEVEEEKKKEYNKMTKNQKLENDTEIMAGDEQQPKKKEEDDKSKKKDKEEVRRRRRRRRRRSDIVEEEKDEDIVKEEVEEEKKKEYNKMTKNQKVENDTEIMAKEEDANKRKKMQDFINKTRVKEQRDKEEKKMEDKMEIKKGNERKEKQEEQVAPRIGSANGPRRELTESEKNMAGTTGSASNRQQLNINASHGFPLLRSLKIDGTDPRMLGLMFGVGSMPKLEELGLMFKAYEEFDQTCQKIFFGINNLSHLVCINCEIDCFPKPEATVADMEATIRTVVSNHPSHPRLVIRKKSLDTSSGAVAALIGLGLLFFPFMLGGPHIVAAANFICKIEDTDMDSYILANNLG